MDMAPKSLNVPFPGNAFDDKRKSPCGDGIPLAKAAAAAKSRDFKSIPPSSPQNKGDEAFGKYEFLLLASSIPSLANILAKLPFIEFECGLD